MEPAFIPLNDARDRVGTIIDVVGVVRKFTSRTKRAGGIFPPSFPASLTNSQSGYTCTLRVSDPSCRSGVIAQFYCELQRELPEVRSLGEIVVLSGMQVFLVGCEIFLLGIQSGSSPPSRQLAAK